MTEKTKEILRKQLQLLSERSSHCATDKELAEVTEAMVKVAWLLLFSDHTIQSASLHNDLL